MSQNFNNVNVANTLNATNIQADSIQCDDIDIASSFTTNNVNCNTINGSVTSLNLSTLDTTSSIVLQLAQMKAYIDNQIQLLFNNPDMNLNSITELANSLQNDKNFSQNILNSLGNKVSLTTNNQTVTANNLVFTNPIATPNVLITNDDNTTTSLISEISNIKSDKADNTYVNTQLALKSDNTYVNTQLALKSDTSYVNTQLGLKANTTDMTSALALKANTTDMTSALSLKANTSDVNTQLSLKANQTDLVTERSRIDALNTRTSNVNNTSDLDKPISTATSQALFLKADKDYMEYRLGTNENSINAVSTNLANNYYNKTQVYSKQEYDYGFQTLISQMNISLDDKVDRAWQEPKYFINNGNIDNYYWKVLNWDANLDKQSGHKLHIEILSSYGFAQINQFPPQITHVYAMMLNNSVTNMPNIASHHYTLNSNLTNHGILEVRWVEIDKHSYDLYVKLSAFANISVFIKGTNTQNNSVSVTQYDIQNQMLYSLSLPQGLNSYQSIEQFAVDSNMLVNGTLSASGQSTVGSLISNGNIIGGGNLTITGNTSVSGTITSQSQINCQSLSVMNNMEIGGILYGQTIFSGGQVGCILLDGNANTTIFKKYNLICSESNFGDGMAGNSDACILMPYHAIVFYSGNSYTNGGWPLYNTTHLPRYIRFNSLTTTGAVNITVTVGSTNNENTFVSAKLYRIVAPLTYQEITISGLS